MKRKNVHLTEEQIRQLARLHERTGLPMAEIMRRALDEFMAQVGEKEVKNERLHKM